MPENAELFVADEVPDEELFEEALEEAQRQELFSRKPLAAPAVWAWPLTSWLSPAIVLSDALPLLED